MSEDEKEMNRLIARKSILMTRIGRGTAHRSSHEEIRRIDSEMATVWGKRLISSIKPTT